MIVLPADHRISEKNKFHEIIKQAFLASKKNKLVTIGIKPTRPETEYGYIELGEVFLDNSIFNVKHFKEKPDKKTAQKFLEKGNFYWNSGMFMWPVNVILKEIKDKLPDLYKGIKKIEQAIDTADFEKIFSDVYSNLEKISIDYGILEKSKNVVCIKASFDWDDLGMWPAMERVFASDKNNNIIVFGEIETLDAKNNICSTDDGIISIIGLDDIVVVRDKNAVLVCAKDRARDVKEIVVNLRGKGNLEYL